MAKNSKSPSIPRIPSKRQAPVISDSVAMRARARPHAATNPYKLPSHPPGTAPPNAKLAMDDWSTWGLNNWDCNWGTGVGTSWAIGGIFEEGLVFPGYANLAGQAQRPEYRKFGEIIATEMTRKWIKLSSTADEEPEEDNDTEGDAAPADPNVPPEEPSDEDKHEDKVRSQKIAEIMDELDRLRARDVFRKCIELDEWFGRSHLYIDTGDTEDRDELKTSIGDGRNQVSLAKFGKGSLKAIRAVEPVWVYPIDYTAIDPLRDDWYEPQTWFVLGKQVHRTRLLKFVGREVPDLLKPAYSFGGLSMTQMARPYVDNWLRTRQSVSDLIHAFSVFVLKTNLGTSLTDSGDQLFKRVDLFNNLRDNRGIMLIDKESEEFQNVSASIGGLHELQSQAQEQLCSVASIPVVRYLGLQAAGLNNSDEGNVRMFYDWIAAQQEKRMRQQLTSVIDFVQLSLYGEIDSTIVFTFEPLREMDESQEAELRQKEAQTDIEYINAGVLSQYEVRKKVAADADSPYASIDVDDVPDLQQEEQEGLDPTAALGGAGGGAPSPPQPEGAEEEDAFPDELEGAESAEGLGESEKKVVNINERRRYPVSGVPHPGENFAERAAARTARHETIGSPSFEAAAAQRQGAWKRGEGPFHERAAERSQAAEQYLAMRVAARKSGLLRAAGLTDDEWSDLIGDEAIELAEPEEDWEEIAQDDSNFEAKHPRDKDGKFASYNTGPNLKKALEETGFSKIFASPSGKFQYTDTNGNKIVVEPPTGGSKQSSKWTLYTKDGKKVSGETGKTLSSQMSKLGGVSPQVKEAVKTVIENPLEAASSMAEGSEPPVPSQKPAKQKKLTKAQQKEADKKALLDAHAGLEAQLEQIGKQHYFSKPTYKKAKDKVQAMVKAGLTKEEAESLLSGAELNAIAKNSYYTGGFAKYYDQTIENQKSAAQKAKEQAEQQKKKEAELAKLTQQYGGVEKMPMDKIEELHNNGTLTWEQYQTAKKQKAKAEFDEVLQKHGGDMAKVPLHDLEKAYQNSAIPYDVYQQHVAMAAAAADKLAAKEVAGKSIQEINDLIKAGKAKSSHLQAKVQEVLNTMKNSQPTPTADEKASITAYTGNAYASINSHLRNAKSNDIEANVNSNHSAKNIQSYLKKCKFPDDLVLYRKVSSDYAKFLRNSVAFEGAGFQEKGFASTSPAPDVWGGSLTMEISVKKGQSGASVKHMSHHSSENEVLLPAGTKYRVTEWDPVKEHMKVEVIEDVPGGQAAKAGTPPSPNTPPPPPGATSGKPGWAAQSPPGDYSQAPSYAEGAEQAYKDYTAGNLNWHEWQDAIDDLEAQFNGGSPVNVAAASKSASATAGKTPLKMSDLKKTGNKLGSNEGGTYEAPNGDKYYIKQGKSKSHVQNELLAGSLFQLAGVPTLDYQPVEGGDHIATKWEKFDKNNVSQFTPEERKAAQSDFAVHAWLANWDAAGLDNDNMSAKGGKVIPNDLGGSLLYRAQGAPKGDKFGNTVGEWDTLRNAQMNPQNAALFSGMTDAELKASAKRVTSIPNDKIREAVKSSGLGDALADQLIARKNDIAKRAGVMAVDANWEESKHPRGQPGNAGQFGPGGVGGAAKPQKVSKKKAAVPASVPAAAPTKKSAAPSSRKQKMTALAEQAGIVPQPKAKAAAKKATAPAWTEEPAATPDDFSKEAIKAQLKKKMDATHYVDAFKDFEWDGADGGSYVTRNEAGEVERFPAADFNFERSTNGTLRVFHKKTAWEKTKTLSSKELKPVLDKLKGIAAQQTPPTPDEQKAIKNYTANGYKMANTALRNGKTIAQVGMSKLQNYLKNNSIPEDITVYRGIGGGMKGVEQFLASMEVGASVQDAAFMSTTMRTDLDLFSSGGAYLEISVKKGTKGAAVYGYAGPKQKEAEVLFPAGMKLRVTGRDGNKIKVELVDDDLRTN